MKERIEEMMLPWVALLLPLLIAGLLWAPDEAALVVAACLAGGAIVLCAIAIRVHLRLGARKRLVSMRRKAQTAVRHVVTSGVLLLAVQIAEAQTSIGAWRIGEATFAGGHAARAEASVTPDGQGRGYARSRRNFIVELACDEGDPRYIGVYFISDYNRTMKDRGVTTKPVFTLKVTGKIDGISNPITTGPALAHALAEEHTGHVLLFNQVEWLVDAIQTYEGV